MRVLDSQEQHRIIRLWVLGGADAVGRHSTQAVCCLIRDGYLDHNGPTEKAREYVEEHY